MPVFPATEAGQQHEEFRLRLSKERDVELAAINVNRDIARAHSEVVGEALKAAKIDIVGGENDLFEKIVRAVGNGKSVDRLIGNSDTLSDIKNTFFTGDGDHFRTQLRKWNADFGISSEDLKNLTIAALLGEIHRHHQRRQASRKCCKPPATPPARTAWPTPWPRRLLVTNRQDR